MTLSPYVRIVARGAGRARPLDFNEARAALEVILDGAAEPEAVGALLMVLRLRGETAEEIAGFTAALRSFVHVKMPQADLDWPCYAAGRTRGAPLFLLAARLVAQCGYSVSLHGWNSHQQTSASVRDFLEPLGIGGIGSGTLTYAPLEELCPEAYHLVRLRDVFGLRSCINTVLRMWNPSRASASVQGVFHPSYRGLQATAAHSLNQQHLTIIKGGGGEFERHPGKATQVFGLRDGHHIQMPCPALVDDTRKLHEPDHAVDMMDLWLDRARDDFATATVIGTAGLALWTLGAAADVAAADALAARLWETRLTQESILT